MLVESNLLVVVAFVSERCHSEACLFAISWSNEDRGFVQGVLAHEYSLARAAGRGGLFIASLHVRVVPACTCYPSI